MGTGGWVWWLLRVVATLLALDAYLQAVLAGGFLSGTFGMLLAHRENGTLGVAVLSFVLIVVSILAWRICRAPGVFVVLSVLLSGAIVGQIILGFDRVLSVHIPLGVLIIGLATVLAVRAWRWAPHD